MRLIEIPTLDDANAGRALDAIIVNRLAQHEAPEDPRAVLGEESLEQLIGFYDETERNLRFTLAALQTAAEYAAASDRYVAARNQLGPRVPRDDSAGGMPVRVKCLHTLYAHHLATRDNPIGAWVAERVEPMPCPAPCVTVDDV
ncbi:MAG: DUF501 domain-containing protein [Actinobacteria bacterium]|nr:DUF501 domain-containing protein [Actinomycetota bacterium]